MSDVKKQQMKKQKSLSRLIKKSKRLISRGNSNAIKLMRAEQLNSTERVRRVRTGANLVDIIKEQH